ARAASGMINTTTMQPRRLIRFSSRGGLLQIPGLRVRVGMKELDKQIGDLFAARIAGMCAVVVSQVVPIPDQAVFTRRGPIGPQIGSPKNDRRFRFAFGRVSAERGITFDLTVDDPANRK